MKMNIKLGMVATMVACLAAFGCGDDGDTGTPANNANNANNVNNTNNGIDFGTTDMGADDMGNPVDMGAPTDMGTVDDMGSQNDMSTQTDMGGQTDMGSQTDMGGQNDMAPPILGPQIRVSPSDRIDYGNVILQTTIDVDVIVENVGDANLVLDFVDLAATPSQGFAVNPTVSSAMPVTLTPGSSNIYTVSFTPTVRSSFANDLRIDSNDADDPRVEVELRGTGRSQIQASCFYTAPDELDFGTVTPGTSVTRSITIGNCGTLQNVTVTTIEFDDPPGTPFTFSGPTIPMTLTPGQTDTVAVTFSPTAVNEVSNRLNFRSDAQIGTTNEVDLAGDGGGCVEALARGESLAEQSDSLRNAPVLVVLNDSVELDASETDSPGGSFVPAWSVAVAPSNSTAAIANSTAITTSFVPDVAGEYTLELDASDPSTGTPSCGTPSQLTVVAIASAPELRVEANWMADHDLDLHMVRGTNNNFPQFGNLVEDVFYDNLMADWGVMGVATDNAFHYGDDTDGSGPEVIALAEYEPSRRYRVGVQFARRDGLLPAQFPVTVVVTSDSGMGPAQQETLSHTFFVNQVGTYWIPFEIASNGNITVVDTTP